MWKRLQCVQPAARQVAAVALLVVTQTAMGGLTIERTKQESPVSEEQVGLAFDPQQYAVMADQSYEVLMEYGTAESFDAAPSYGDVMLLSEALNLLLPDGWQALRNKDMQATIHVSWNIDSGDWLDVLRNLGARHGIQFHVDHTRKKVFLRDGRRILVEPAVELDAAATSKTAKPGAKETRVAKPLPPTEPQTPSVNTGKGFSGALNDIGEITFDVRGGDEGRKVMEDLAVLLGYDRVYWLTERKLFPGSQVVQGSPRKVISMIAESLNVRSCVYNGSSNAIAVVSKKAECPK